MKNPYLSIVIPAKNEEKNVKLIHEAITKVLNKMGKTYEVIFVDDGSTDETFKEAEKIGLKDHKFKVVKLRGNWGKSVGLQVGFEKALGTIIITLDADLQDDPNEIPNLLAKLEEGYDLVSGWKRKRHDPISKVIPSRILNNFLIPFLTGVKLHDNNCGFKAYKRNVVQNLHLHGELYRFIPILAQKQNFKVAEVEVKHHERIFGKSKFGWERNIKGFLDLITIFFLTTYVKRPGHFFGGMGFISFFFGFLIGLYITFLRITTGTIQFRQPLLFLGMLLMIIGVQLVTTGLVAEMIVHFNQKTSSTEGFIEKTLN